MTDVQLFRLGEQAYIPVWRAMQDYNESRSETDPDQLWLVQHPPVFTQGLNGKPEHLLNTGNIPVVEIDRGGQVTYHGPGQLVMYCLLDLKRNKLGVRQVVSALENAVIALLSKYGIDSKARADAPGVYVGEAKIAALGLRVKRGCCYHGLSLNVDMDLSPFQEINPCGYKNMPVTQLSSLGVNRSMRSIEDDLIDELSKQLGFSVTEQDGLMAQNRMK